MGESGQVLRRQAGVSARLVADSQARLVQTHFARTDGTENMRRTYIVSAVLLLGITGAAGYYYYHMTCCSPPKICCAPQPIEPARIDQGT